MNDIDFTKTAVMSKIQWRKEASRALSNLTVEEVEEVRRRIRYPLRVKDFNTRLCKRLLEIIREVENETNRNPDDS